MMRFYQKFRALIDYILVSYTSRKDKGIDMNGKKIFSLRFAQHYPARRNKKHDS